MIRVFRAAAIFIVITLCAACSVLELPFRLLGLQRRALNLVSTASLPEDLLVDSGFDFSRPETIQPTIAAIDESLKYLSSPKSAERYAAIQLPGFQPASVRQSLLRFKELLRTSRSAEEFRNSVLDEFAFYRAAGSGVRKEVLFTAYCEPEFEASRVQTPEFQFPIFGAPPTLASWGKPHPVREQLEGSDGRGAMLRGSELFYLRDRFDVIFTQIQGSALLRIGEQRARVGFSGATDYPFKSIAMALIRDGLLAREQASAGGLRAFFSDHPDLLARYANENNRVVFFRELQAGGGPVGSLGRPLVAERAMATDRKLFPPGALTLIRGEFPFQTSEGQIANSGVSRFLLDQDTGSAIKGTDRVDLFFGSGNDACARAGTVRNRGDLYYLLLRNPSDAEVAGT